MADTKQILDQVDQEYGCACPDGYVCPLCDLGVNVFFEVVDTLEHKLVLEGTLVYLS